MVIFRKEPLIGDLIELFNPYPGEYGLILSVEEWTIEFPERRPKVEAWTCKILNLKTQHVETYKLNYGILSSCLASRIE